MCVQGPNAECMDYHDLSTRYTHDTVIIYHHKMMQYLFLLKGLSLDPRRGVELGTSKFVATRSTI